MGKPRFCSYCGFLIKRGDQWPSEERYTAEHVFPDAIFPESMRRPADGQSGINLITVPACHRCNVSFSDDEVCFMNMLPLCSTAGPEVGQVDSSKRAVQLMQYLKVVEEDGIPRLIAYPGHDPKCLRIVKKMIRGLCAKHNLGWPVDERHVWASVCPYEVPPAFMPKFRMSEPTSRIVQYGFDLVHHPFALSFWYFKFLERAVFVGGVNRVGHDFHRTPRKIMDAILAEVRENCG